MAQDRITILNVLIDPVCMREAVAAIVKGVTAKANMRVVTANPEMIFAAQQDQALQQVINTAELITPDGTGVVWAAKTLGFPVAERVTGIDLLQNLWSYADQGKWRVYILGSRPGVAEQAIDKLKAQYPGILWACQHGYYDISDEGEVIRRIKEFQPNLLLAGLGSPRQEYWLAQHMDLADVSIGVGGSFDVISGLVPRAPLWIQNLRGEWLYRLWLDPKRRKRQSVLPKFVIAVLRQKYSR